MLDPPCPALPWPCRAAASRIPRTPAALRAPKLVVWISPGWPLLAHSAGRNNDQLFDSIVYFSGLLRDVHITLSAISPAGLSPTLPSPGLPPRQVINGSTVRGGPTATPAIGTGPAAYESYYKPAKSARQANPNDLVLEVLAHQTGGLVSTPSNTIEPQIAPCLAEAEALYVLSLDLATSSTPARHHDLEVKIPRAGVEIHAPAGYYTH